MITWNVRQGGKPERQAEPLTARAPDLIALQEITAATAGRWEAALGDRGYETLTTRDLIGEQTYGVLLASRWPATRLWS